MNVRLWRRQKRAIAWLAAHDAENATLAELHDLTMAHLNGATCPRCPDPDSIPDVVV